MSLDFYYECIHPRDAATLALQARDFNAFFFIELEMNSSKRRVIYQVLCQFNFNVHWQFTNLAWLFFRHFLFRSPLTMGPCTGADRLPLAGGALRHDHIRSWSFNSEGVRGVGPVMWRGRPFGKLRAASRQRSWVSKKCCRSRPGFKIDGLRRSG